MFIQEDLRPRIHIFKWFLSFKNSQLGVFVFNIQKLFKSLVRETTMPQFINQYLSWKMFYNSKSPAENILPLGDNANGWFQC